MAYDCKFYAEKKSAHKGSPLAGTVLIVAKKLTPAMRNGATVKAVGVPRDAPFSPPCATWVHPGHLVRRCVEVSETEARTIAPRMFDALDRHNVKPEFRAMHALEIARAFDDGRYSMQPADERIIDIIAPSKAEETDYGFR
jgi:hypothetical protein